MANGAPSRDIRLDALRGVAITLVVALHLHWASAFISSPSRQLTELWSEISQVAAPLAVPLFAFVSGMLMLRVVKREPRAFVVSRLKALMLPYFAWLIVYWLDPETRPILPRGASLVHYIVSATLFPTGDNQGPVWFLLSLFIASIAFYALLRLRVPTPWIWLVVCCTLLVPHVLSLLRLTDPLDVRGAATVFPYLVVGFFAHSWTERLSKRPVLGVIGLTCVYLLVTAAVHSRLAYPVWEVGLLHPVMIALREDLAGTLRVLLLIATSLSALSLLPRAFLSPLASLGKRSLGICGAHLPVMALILSLGIRAPWLLLLATLSLSWTASWLLARNDWTRFVLLGGRGKDIEQAALQVA